MLAMSSSSSSHHQLANPFLDTNLGGSSSSPWPLVLEDPFSNPNYYKNQHNLLDHHHHRYQSSTSPLPLPSPFVDLPLSFAEEDREQQQITKRDNNTSNSDTLTTTTTTKKLNHNASERHRRKKINTLYSSLRSMLPTPSDHHPTSKKKLSIPTTVSRVLKYIPELQLQVEALARKKKELLSAISAGGGDKELGHVDRVELDAAKNDRKGFTGSSSPSEVSTSWLNEEEVMIQISAVAGDNGDDGNSFQISEVLLRVQETGLVLVNGSSFRCFEGRVFYSLHLKVEGTHGVGALDSKGLSETLLNLAKNALRRRSS